MCQCVERTHRPCEGADRGRRCGLASICQLALELCQTHVSDLHNRHKQLAPVR